MADKKPTLDELAQAVAQKLEGDLPPEERTKFEEFQGQLTAKLAERDERQRAQQRRIRAQQREQQAREDAAEARFQRKTAIENEPRLARAEAEDYERNEDREHAAFEKREDERVKTPEEIQEDEELREESQLLREEQEIEEEEIAKLAATLDEDAPEDEIEEAVSAIEFKRGHSGVVMEISLYDSADIEALQEELTSAELTCHVTEHESDSIRLNAEKQVEDCKVVSKRLTLTSREPEKDFCQALELMEGKFASEEAVDAALDKLDVALRSAPQQQQGEARGR